MTAQSNSDMPWVIFRINNQLFAVSANDVREMVTMPKIAAVPKTPDYVRGVINLRGKVMSVVDLRLRLGIESALQEMNTLIDMMGQREQDHKNWIAELEASVREHREFRLATDPHKCAFGKWYDHFKTDNSILAACLRKFDEPHKRIHGIAEEVTRLAEEEDFDSAYTIIERTKQGDLTEMINLFSEVRQLLRETIREIALIVEKNAKTIAIAVDSVESVGRIVEDSIQDMPEMFSGKSRELVTGTGRQDKGNDNELILTLTVDQLLANQNMNPPDIHV